MPPLFTQCFTREPYQDFQKKEEDCAGTPDSKEVYWEISLPTSHLELPTANGPPQHGSQAPWPPFVHSRDTLVFVVGGYETLSLRGLM